MGKFVNPKAGYESRITIGDSDFPGGGNTWRMNSRDYIGIIAKELFK